MGKIDKINKLIAYLFAIQALSKNIHYSVKGEAFYSKHLLADEIYKGIDEQIDALIETCILITKMPLSIEDYWKEASQIILIYSFENNFESLLHLVEDTMTLVNVSEFSNTASSLIDDIGKDLQRKAGLLTRQVKND